MTECCLVLKNLSAIYILLRMESAESQTELLEALLKWMASFRVAAGIMQGILLISIFY